MVSCGHRKWSFPFDSKQLLHMSPHSIAKTTFMKLWANLREFGILFIAINGRFCIGHPCIFTGRLGQRFAWTKKHPQAWLVKNGFHSRYLVQLDAKSSKSDVFFWTIGIRHPFREILKSPSSAHHLPCCSKSVMFRGMTSRLEKLRSATRCSSSFLVGGLNPSEKY